MLEQLRKLVGEDRVWINEPMKNHTTFRAGGCADYLVEPESVDAVREIVRLCCQENMPYYVVGNGSNLLVSDKGYHGVILHLYKNMSDFEISGNHLKAQAGALLVRVAKMAAKEGLSGLEFASGIPGTIGGSHGYECRCLRWRDKGCSHKSPGTFCRTGPFGIIREKKWHLAIGKAV